MFSNNERRADRDGMVYVMGQQQAGSKTGGMWNDVIANRQGGTPYPGMDQAMFSQLVSQNANQMRGPMQMQPAIGIVDPATGAVTGPPPTQVTTQDPSGRAPGLGLGLGLNARQRARFQAAAQQGQGAQYLGEHQQLANRVQNRVEAGSPQEARLQNFIATGQSQRPGLGGPYARNPNRLMR